MEVKEEEKKKKVGEEKVEAVDAPEMRKGWSQRSPLTLIDFLARVELLPLADGGIALLCPVNIARNLDT